MKRLAIFLAALAMATGAYGQQQSSLPFPLTTITAPANNQCLVYQSSSKTWVNGSCASGGGATVTGSPTAGQVTKFSGAGTITNAVAGTDYQAPLSIATGNLLGNVSGSTATPVALPLPTINLAQLGACGITDGTTIFNAAATAAASTGQALYIPGNCTLNHTGTLTLNGLTLVGDGVGSILKGTDSASSDPHLALYIQGTGTTVRGINFQTSNTAARSSQVYAAAITVPVGVGATLSQFRIQDNYFTSSFAGPDIQLAYAGSYGDISRNFMLAGSKSNPMIVQANGAAVTNLTISQNTMTGTSGDTCIELVDYSNGATIFLQNVLVENNNLEMCGAEGVSAVGGSHISFIGNSIKTVSDRGILILSDVTFTSPAVNHILVKGNQVQAASAADAYILVSGRSGFPASDVVVEGNILDITTTTAAGIKVGACDTCSSADIRTSRVDVIGNHINGDGTHGTTGITVRGANDVSILGNDISAIQQQAVYSFVGNSGALKVNNNHFQNLSIASSGANEAVYLGNSGFAIQQVMGNSYVAGANTISHFATCSGSPTLMMDFNLGANDLSGCSDSNITANGGLGTNFTNFGGRFQIVGTNSASGDALYRTGAGNVCISTGGVQAGCFDASQNLNLVAAATLVTKTVATLPTCNSGAKGQMYAVSDASSPTYNATLTGSSTTWALAVCNGVNWTAH
jgi:hypothetical protein